MTGKTGANASSLRSTHQTDIGVGIIITEGNKGDVARNIRQADRRGHPILVICLDTEDIGLSTISGNLSKKVILLPSARTIEKAHESLIEHGKSLPISGLILQDPAAPRIGYEQSYRELEEGGEFATGSKTTEPETKDDQKSIAAIIPAYNESGSIEDVILSTSPYVDSVIVVNDASTDRTEEIARKHADRVVTHPKNMGVGGAVHTGYMAAAQSECDIVVQIDADGQHDPSHIPRMVELVDEEEADMVIGSRWLNESHQKYSFLRRSGIRFFTHEVNAIAGTNVSDVTSGFRAYRASELEKLGRPANSHWAVEQTLEAARRGWQIEEVSVPMPPEVEGSQFDVETFLKYPFRMVFTTLKVLLFR
jgi:hypothetical protein